MDWQELGAIAGVLAFIGFGLQWWATARRNARNDLIVEIKADSARATLIEKYHNTRSERYYSALDVLLDRAERFYGPRWSLRAFGTCLTLAFIYPLIAALLAWVVAGQTQIGTLEVFNAVDGAWARAARACLFLGGMGAAALIVWAGLRYSDPLGLWAEKKVETITTRAGFLSKAARVVMQVAAVAVASAFAVAVASAFAFAVAVASAGAFAFAFAGAVAGAFAFAGAGAFAFAGAVAGAFAFAVAFAGATAESQLLLFLYVLLPLGNALADWASVSLTRWFLQDARKHQYGPWALMGYVALDFLAGLACLALLLAALVGLLEIWALFDTPPLDWREYWAAARADRWQGVALWLMCFTTLLPTLIHVAWGLAVWLFDSPEATRNAVEEMRHWDTDAKEDERAATALLVAKGLQAGARVQVVRVSAFFTVLACAAWWFEIWALIGISDWLAGMLEDSATEA